MKNILMNTEMTKAILDGRKVQTRRVATSTAHLVYVNALKTPSAKYQKGETIWVREPVLIQSTFTQNGIDMFDYVYKADKEEHRDTIPKHHLFKRWMDNNKSIPNGCIKEMARIFLKITDVRVERLQDISHEDCFDEGYCYGMEEVSLEWFIRTWDKTAPKGYKFKDNPYVFVNEFERVEK